MYVSFDTSKCQDGKARFTYHCAQYEGQQTKSAAGRARKGKDAPATSRARETMDRFDCGGWLYITLMDDVPGHALVRLTHKHHTPYTDISISPEMLRFLEKNNGESASKVSVDFETSSRKALTMVM